MARDSDGAGTPKRKGRLVRVLVWGGLGLGLVLLTLVAFAPVIAAPIVRPMVQDGINQQIRGTVEVRELGLSWFGSQVVGVSLDDPDGAPVADVEVYLDPGLMGLALGSRDLGSITITGDATITRDAEGVTNLQRAIEMRNARPDAAPSGEPVVLPPELRATVVLDGVRLTVEDASLAQATGGVVGAFGVGGLDGALTFVTGQPVTLELAGPISTGAGLDSLTESGTLDLRVDVDGLVSGTGEVQPESVDAALALALVMPGVQLAAEAGYADGVVVTTGPTALTVVASELVEMVPDLREALAAQPNVTIETLPDLSVRVDRLSAPLSGDLGGFGGLVTLETTVASGRIDAPVGEETRSSAFRLEPLTLVLDAPSLRDAFTLTGGAEARIDGASAGALSVDLAARGVLDENGAFRAGPPEEIEGGIRVEGFSTPILQPFVAALAAAMPEGLELDLPNDLGPQLDLALETVKHLDGSGAYDVDLVLAAARASLDASVVVEGQRISTRGQGVQGDLRSLASLVDPLVEAYGVRTRTGVNLRFHATELDFDLEKLLSPEGPDLRGVRAKAEIELTDASGEVRVGEQGVARPYALERVALGLATDDASGEVTLTGRFDADLNGETLGAGSLDMTFSGLLDGAGAPSLTSLPAFRGQLRCDGLALDTIETLLGPTLGEAGISLVGDVGPRGDFLVQAASDPGAGPDVTSVDVSFRSSHVDLSAPLSVAPDRIRSRESITLVARRAAQTIGRVMGVDGPVRLAPEGSARVVVVGLDVPLDEGGVRPDRVSADVRLSASGVAAELGLPGDDGVVRSRERVAVESFGARFLAVAGGAPEVQADARFVHRDQPFDLRLVSSLDRVFLDAPADPSDPMSVLAPERVVPRAEFSLSDVPVSLARMVPLGAARVGDEALDLVLLSRDGLGRTVTLTATSEVSKAREDMAVWRFDLKGERLSAWAGGRFRADFTSVDQGRLTSTVTRRVASHLSTVLAPDAPLVPSLTEPAWLSLGLNAPVEVPLAEGFEPRLDATSLDLTLSARAAVGSMTIPASEPVPGEAPADPLVIPPLRLDGLEIAVRAPLSVLEEAGGVAEVTLSGNVSEGETALVTVRGEGSARLASGVPAGEMPASLTISEINAPWIDRLIAKQHLLEGAIGERFTLGIEAQVHRLLNRDPSGPAIALSIDSQRVQTDRPVSFAINQQAAFLREPAEISWLMGPRWANLFFLGSPPGGPKPALAPTKQTPLALSIRSFAIATEEGVGPLKPGVFLMNVTATAPEVAAELRDGRSVVFGGTEIFLGQSRQSEHLAFTFKVPRLRVGDGPETRPDRDTITGRIDGLADAAGNLTPDALRLTAQGGLAPIPTGLVDALAQQDGLLVDVLGDQLSFEVDAQEFGTSGGRLTASATAPFASAEIAGVVRDGLFVIDPNASVVEATRVTREATARLQKALPVLATLEKTGDDRPARVIFETPITLPLDGNLDRLNGQLTLDLGTASFGTTSFFQTLLSVTQQRSAGELGRRMPPLKVTMVDGLVSYEKYPLPLGEFTIETQGFVNLGSRSRRIREGGGEMLPAGELEVLTFIPAGALAAEAVPGIADLPLPLVQNLARLPVRTSGLIAGPKTGVAADLIGQEAVNTLIEPGRLLEEGGGLLQDLLGGG